MAKFFISYRRTDTAQIVGRIYERLAAYFGPDGIYVDIESVPVGIDFPTHIQEFISNSDVLLIIIGESWVDGFQHKEVTAESEDYVKIELELALRQSIPLIPILIGETPMPKHTQLPSTVSQIALRNAFRLDLGREFNADMSRLINYLDSIRITKALAGQPVSDYHLIRDAVTAILAFLRREYDSSDDVKHLWLNFVAYGSVDFDTRPMETGVSLFLHRIVQDSASLIEIHFILTAWARDALTQYLIIGWVIDKLRRNPILPAELVQDAALVAIPPGITLRIFPSTEHVREIWSSVSQQAYQISASYVLRVSF